MNKTFVVVCIVLLMLTSLAACNTPTPTPSSPPVSMTAQDLLPNLPGYNTIEDESFTDALTSLGVMASLAGQLELGAPIAAVSEVVSCYQDAGAVSARIYSSQANPIHSGVVAVGDRNAILNPLTFLQCVGSSRGPNIQSATIQPCTRSYTLSHEDNEFYIIYAGLTQEVCEAFCTNLEGCTQ